ncbi:MAG: hypothetical protein ACRD4Q_01825, partial [Candidatus Acidiferrales bacterium]
MLKAVFLEKMLRWAAASTFNDLAPCWFVSDPWRNSRMRFRRKILARRSRPNLDLSPFLSDIVTSAEQLMQEQSSQASMATCLMVTSKVDRSQLT